MVADNPNCKPPPMDDGWEPTKPKAPKSPAIEAWCELFSMPCPKTEIDFKRALMMAVIIGRQIESEYNVAEMPNADLRQTLTTPPRT